jgi:hypothetical protein
MCCECGYVSTRMGTHAVDQLHGRDGLLLAASWRHAAALPSHQSAPYGGTSPTTSFRETKAICAHILLAFTWSYSCGPH